MICETSPSLVEGKTGFNINQIPDVKAWIESIFDAAGKDVPDFEYTPQSISHLHNLAIRSRANTQAALIVANDLNQKAAEYSSRGHPPHLHIVWTFLALTCTVLVFVLPF